MTVPATSRRAGPFAGSGTLSSFPFTFKVLSSTPLLDVRVSDGTVETLLSPSAYTVAVNADQVATPGGSVSYLLPVGQSLTILDGTSVDQQTQLPTGGAYRAKVVEAALDKLTVLVQKLAERLNRTLTLPANATGVSTELPPPAGGAFIGWNSTGSALRNVDPSTAASIVAYAAWRTETFVGGAASYTLAADPGNANNCDVSVNGVAQVPGLNFTVSGTVLTPTPAWAPGALVAVRYGQALPQGTLDASATTYTSTGAGAQSRSVASRLNDEVSAKGFANLAAAAASGAAALLIPAGTYTLTSSVSFPMPVRVLPGASIVRGAGVTVSFPAGFTAGVYGVFSGAGTTAFDPATTPAGYAEWFGAISGDPSKATINTAAINEAIVALKKVELMPADYTHDNTIFVTAGGREVMGAGSRYDGVTSKAVTRLICTSTTAHAVQLGATSFPGSVNAMPRDIKLSRLCVQRATGPNVTSGCDGVRLQYALYARLSDVQSRESVNGFEFYGTVHCKVDDCHAFRSQVGSGGSDLFKGFYANGSAAIGLNGGNASLYLNRCLAEIGGLSLPNSQGFVLDGKFTDTFITLPETSGCATSIMVTGDGGTSWASNAYTNLDLQIVSPICDTFTSAGIYISGANKFGAIEVMGGYYGAAAGATAAVHVVNSAGTVNVIGGQALMGAAPGCYGVRAASASGVKVDGLQILEAASSAVVLDTATNCSIEPVIKNHNQTCPAAVQLFNACTANFVRPTVMGAAGKVSLGVQVVGTADARNEYSLTGIDSGCLAGGSANKLTRNGTQITAVGLSGTNLVSGVMS